MKDENTEALKTKLQKTKRIMQVLTCGAIVMLGIFIYGRIKKDVGVDSSFSLITIVLGFIVIVLDRKYKKIKAELESKK